MDSSSGRGIAVVGLAARLPGASSLDDFWTALRDRRDLLAHFSDDMLASAGVPPEVAARPGYVKAGYVLADIEQFDADFFGMTPREASLMDPQIRIMLECAVEALESAGYGSADPGMLVGMYAGASLSGYIGLVLEAGRSFGELLQVLLSNDKDHLCTRIAHKLNLRGPAVTVQTACSTALVSVHLACQSLLAGDCDLALAGGVTARVPDRAGYLHEPGLASPDGCCRTFDAAAAGTVFSMGAGLVALKRFEDARAAGDHIHAVILGSAINNDGALKANYAAPSKDGQRRAIEEALAVAGVDADSIGYVEAHGTATPLGDPLEIAALTEAFSRSTSRRQYCAIGSVKSNIGHLESAAGIAGLIKVILSLEHGELPALQHFQQPNPAINFEETPFFPLGQNKAWRREASPRRAGVSSFGMGGTNAHLIVEEAPPPPPAARSRPWKLLPIAARTPRGVAALSRQLAGALEQQGDLSLDDCGYTLALGRRPFAERRVVIAGDRAGAIAALGAESSPSALAGSAAARSIVGLFPGQGSQFPGMSAGLAASEPLFRQHLTACAEALRKHARFDLLGMLSSGARDEAAERALANTALAQPALFAVEHSLAMLWAAWGIEPDVMLGHSLGEYVAACLAGVLSLEDALALVAARGQLMQELPGGSMLAVELSEAEAGEFLAGGAGLAAINGPRQVVLSGPTSDIDACARRLSAAGVNTRKLQVSHAFHSVMTEPILGPFAERLRRVTLRPPRRRYVSNLTGTWITADQATSVDYWVEHLRRPVRFSDGLLTAAQGGAAVLLEIGPGRILGALARQQGRADLEILPSLPQARETRSDQEVMLRSLARLWTLGAPVNWRGFYAAETRRRVPLPTYPFERRRHAPDLPRLARPATANGGPAAPNELPAPATAGPATGGPAQPAPGDEGEMQSLWRELFGDQTLSLENDFFDLGGTSLLASELLARVRARYDLVVPMDQLFQARTAGRFAAVVRQLRGGAPEGPVQGSPRGPDLQADVTLAPEIAAPQAYQHRVPAQVLLTGSTGFFGAFLLRSLWQRTDARIVCLVRAPDAGQALDRIVGNLRAYELWDESMRARITAEPGDLERPRLGLTEPRFARLAADLDAIVHGGAYVNFTYPYQALRAANVSACQEVLRLAATTKTKSVSFISTAALFSNSHHPRMPAAREDDPLLDTDELRTGYLQSKWVAEKLMEVGRSRGIPVSVFRPGTIAGDSRTGRFNQSDFIIRMIKSCIQLGVAPAGDTLVHMAPADCLSDAVVEIGVRQPPRNLSYHLVPPSPVTGDELFEEVRRLGYRLRSCSYPEWFEVLLDATKRSQDNALAPFVPFLTSDLREIAPFLDSSNTAAALHGTSVSIPVLDGGLLRTYFRHFVDSGFLSSP